MSLITDYSSLVAAALDNAHRTDAKLTAAMDRLVQLAEMEIFREMPLLQLELTQTGATTAQIPYPPGLAKIERISVNTYGVDTTLDYVAPAAYRPSGVGEPCTYVVENRIINLIPAPAGPYTYTLYYIADFSPISVSNPTNWLITNAPDVYFYALNIQVSIWTKDQEEQAQNIPLYQRAMESVQSKDRRRQFPARGGMRIRSRFSY